MNNIHIGDNLQIMKDMNSESIDLIYLDPPFNTRKDFVGTAGSFSDKINKEYITEITLPNKIEDLLSTVLKISNSLDYYYLLYMAPRLIEMQRLLKDTGSIYLHCDPTMSHYLKLLMDAIFGRSNFRNEIIWNYQAGTKGRKQFGRKHDCIYFYSKTKNALFNRISQPVVNPKAYNKIDNNGRFYQVNGQGKTYYLDNGRTCDDVWTWIGEREMNSLTSNNKERTGYPTQKPLALLERIIKASSNKGDIVLDPFCGSGTTCLAAQSLSRKYIGIDLSEKAIKTAEFRLLHPPH